MPLSIKNPHAERLVRQIASETGESLTGAIEKALEERWQRLQQQRHHRIVSSQLEEILRRVDALPNLDSRSEDDILGYDENGIPRER